MERAPNVPEAIRNSLREGDTECGHIRPPGFSRLVSVKAKSYLDFLKPAQVIQKLMWKYL